MKKIFLGMAIGCIIMLFALVKLGNFSPIGLVTHLPKDNNDSLKISHTIAKLPDSIIAVSFKGLAGIHSQALTFENIAVDYPKERIEYMGFTVFGHEFKWDVAVDFHEQRFYKGELRLCIDTTASEIITDDSTITYRLLVYDCLHQIDAKDSIAFIDEFQDRFGDNNIPLQELNSLRNTMRVMAGDTLKTQVDLDDLEYLQQKATPEIKKEIEKLLLPLKILGDTREIKVELSIRGSTMTKQKSVLELQENLKPLNIR